MRGDAHDAASQNAQEPRRIKPLFKMSERLHQKILFFPQMI